MRNRAVLREQLNRCDFLWREGYFIYEEWSQNRGLSFNCVLVLHSIYEDMDHCTQKKISQQWFMPKQTVNMILKDFEKRGFIELIPMQSDKRNKLIHTTAAGKQYVSEIISDLQKLELSVAEKMGAERLESLNENMALFVELFRQGNAERYYHHV